MVLKANRDREERQVTRDDPDQLAFEDPWEQTGDRVQKAHWVMWGQEDREAILVQQALQDPREALVSLVLKDNWEMSV